MRPAEWRRAFCNQWDDEADDGGWAVIRQDVCVRASCEPVQGRTDGLRTIVRNPMVTDQTSDDLPPEGYEDDDPAIPLEDGPEEYPVPPGGVQDGPEDGD